MTYEPLILITPPDKLRVLKGLSVTPAHQAYRVGRGPHLFRAGSTAPVRGGLMVMDDRGFDGWGEPAPLCDEVMRECAARGFQGVVCDFESQSPLLERAVRELGERLSRRNWRLYVPEAYAPCSPRSRVLVSSALSGGSLERRLEEAAERYGLGRVVLAVQRVAEDFFLPSPSGSGSPLTQEELRRRIETRQPSVFFSHELCARYFTYMSQDSGAHFVLFDDGDTIRKKLQLARGMGVAGAVAALEEVEDCLDRLNLRLPSPQGGPR
ncbi:MAG: hypothetical protein HFF39_10575 [Lawsonibacter sp.]|nr:hypothetical protein [Lawsonibacter sp.]